VHKHSLIEGDLIEDSWPQKLTDRGFNIHEPVLWLAEGLVAYIPEPGVRKLLQTCAELSPNGSYFGVDVGYFPPFARRTPMSQEMQRLGNPFLFLTNEPEKIIIESGWPKVKVNQPGDADMKYSRANKFVIPRWLKIVPRSFLIQASK